VRATVTPEVAARSAYQDQQAEGLITLDELQTKLAALEEARAVARRELAALKEHRERIGHLEKDATTRSLSTTPAWSPKPSMTSPRRSATASTR
jgi:hypothetical protein